MTVSQTFDGVRVFTPREERRPVALAGYLVRNGGEEAHDFVITDLSYGGCRLISAAKLARGDKVDLTVHQKGTIPACVRWKNGSGVGIAFSSEPPPRKEVERKVERLPLQAELVVRRAGRRATILAVTDLSRYGCRLTFEDPPLKGDPVWVALPGLAPVEARVCWVEGKIAGVEFEHSLHESVFDLLLMRWRVSS